MTDTWPTSLLPTLPYALCLTVIIVQWFSRYRYKLAAIIHVVASSLLLLIAINIISSIHQTDMMIVKLGGWPIPFGISLIIDRLGALMLLTFSIVIWAVSIYTLGERERYDINKSYYVSFWLLVLGIIGAITTGDLFNLYVWFELSLLSTFILLSISPIKSKTAILRYAVLNLIGTLMMLLAIIFIYGITGTLNIAAIALFFQQSASPLYYVPFTLLFLFALAVKAGLFPLYFWLPIAYPIPRASTTALFSGLLTKMAMVVLLRLSFLWLPMQAPLVLNILLILALFTMVLGVLGAAIQFDFRKILSFHIVSQIGYIALGIAIHTPLACMATIYFLIHNILVKSNLLLISGYVEQTMGTRQLKSLGDWLSHRPFISIIFFLSAFSLTGFPPLSGFWAKFLLLKAAINQHFYMSSLIAILVSLMTLYSMNKLWNYVFCQPTSTQPTVQQHSTGHAARYVAMCILLLSSLLIGLVPNIILPYLTATSKQLSQTSIYLASALGG